MRLNPGLVLILFACYWQACSPAHSIQNPASPQPAAGATSQRASGTSQSTSNAASQSVSTPPSRPATQLTAALEELLKQPGLQSAHVGVCLYDPASATYKVNYQGDKYFVPASNTKLFSLYAGLKYLADSLVAMGYVLNDTALFIIPSGDPTLLHPEFPDQPVIRLLQQTHRNLYLSDFNWQEKPMGRGWAWDDYNDDYMPERSAFPVYGNLIRWVQDSASASFYSIPEINWQVRFSADTTKQQFLVLRDVHNNAFEITEGKGKTRELDVPFITEGSASAAVLLKDTVGRTVTVRNRPHLPPQTTTLHSRPVDSLFCPMMHNSDNFFAEQTLLMASNELLGKMNDAAVIDTLLKTDLKDLPQHPYWVDGSGLSRNDLFTPQDFIWLLDKLKNEFGLERMKRILPTGGKGTLSSYYRQDSGYIFAKTGSLSGVVALSGYLITKKDHLLLFSILINNYTGSGVTMRRQLEQMIHQFRDKY